MIWTLKVYDASLCNILLKCLIPEDQDLKSLTQLEPDLRLRSSRSAYGGTFVHPVINTSYL